MSNKEKTNMGTTRIKHKSSVKCFKLVVVSSFMHKLLYNFFHRNAKILKPYKGTTLISIIATTKRINILLFWWEPIEKHDLATRLKRILFSMHYWNFTFFKLCKFDHTACTFWLKAKALKKNGYFWPFNLTMMIDLTICQINHPIK
jgi:hypothetical protein